MTPRSPLFLTSELLEKAGVPHGFTLRAGGASAGPFASLNLSRAVGDDAAAVEENLASLARATGLARANRLVAAKQVHRDRVLLARHGDADPQATPILEELFAPSEPEAGAVSGERGPASSDPEADAIATRTPGLAACVRVADCTPILLWSPSIRAGCAVHSGWRGARLSIAGRGVRALESLGAIPGETLAAIGPCIGRCCYEVSPQLAREFRAAFGPEAADDPEIVAKPHLDLRRAAAVALERAGVKPENVDQVEGCTSCEPARFYSHRRDRGVTGRHLAFIFPPA